MMITGFNTDVEYLGKVYHVQTEDKGVSNPVVESLVYTGGQIVDSVKSDYNDLVEANEATEKAVLGRMEIQHQRLIREIRNGKYDPEGPKPFGYNIITNRSLDEVVLDFLEHGPDVESIRVETEGAPVFRAKTDVEVEVHVVTASNDEPRGGADVTVKLISTKEKPAKLFKGKTDREGVVMAKFSIPPLDGAEAALLFQAESEGSNAEFKQLVLPSIEGEDGAIIPERDVSVTGSLGEPSGSNPESPLVN